MAYDPTAAAFSALVHDVDYDLDFGLRFERLITVCNNASHLIDEVATIAKCKPEQLNNQVEIASESIRLIGDALDKLSRDVCSWNGRMEERLVRKIKVDIENVAVAAAA